MRMRYLGALLGASVVLACGGGGGGGGGDGISVTWVPANVTASYDVIDADVHFPVAARLSSVPADAAQVTLVDSGKGFATQALAATSSDGGFTWSATLRPAASLASQATPYTGTLTLHVKRADGTEVALSGASLGYSLTVMDPATDPGCVKGLVTWRGPYAVENNVEANKHAADPYTGDFTQCVYVAPGSTRGVDARWTFAWPDLTSSALRSYPEVEYGQKPWMDPVAGADLPAKLSALGRVTAHVDAKVVRRSADYSGNLGFDLFIVSSLQKDPLTGGMPIVGQVQVFPQSTFLWGCASSRTFTSGGITWDVCSVTNADAARKWPNTIYVQPTAAPGQDIDLMPFIQDFRRHEGSSLIGDDYLTSVEFGNQVFQGTGETALTDFAVTVTKN